MRYQTLIGGALGAAVLTLGSSGAHAQIEPAETKALGYYCRSANAAAPLEQFRLANARYQSFDSENRLQTLDQMCMYSQRWVSQLPNPKDRAEAYHQMAYSAISLVRAEITQECISDNQRKGGVGVSCSGGAAHTWTLNRIREIKDSKYHALIDLAKQAIDTSVGLMPDNQRSRKLQSQISEGYHQKVFGK